MMIIGKTVVCLALKAVSGQELDVEILRLPEPIRYTESKIHIGERENYEKGL